MIDERQTTVLTHVQDRDRNRRREGEGGRGKSNEKMSQVRK